MYKAILWDMDGTLVDSEPLWEIATYEMSESLGKRITPEVHATTVGGTFANTLRICAEYAGVSVTPERAQELKDRMWARMGELLGSELEVRPGVDKLLRELHDACIPMMLVTNTERQVADPAIDSIGRHYFRSTICGDEVTHGKPDPEIYRTAAKRLGFAPEECLVFEDSRSGTAAAAAAGCKLIGLPESGEVPLGALDLRQLHGSTSFLGVTAADLGAWYQAFDH